MMRLLVCLVILFYSSLADASLILGRRGQEVVNQCYGITTVGGSEGSVNNEFMIKYVLSAQDTMRYAYFYGNTTDGGSDGTFRIAIFEDGSPPTTPVISCTDAYPMIDGSSPAWNEIIIPDEVQAAGTYWIAIYPSEAIDYYYQASSSDCYYEDVSCSDPPNGSACTQTPSFKVCNYDAEDYGGSGDAQTYYVTQSGAGTQDGLSIGNAWSASDHNNAANWSGSESPGAIDPGDTVYYSGTFSTQLSVKGSGTSDLQITLDAYEGGDCDPLTAECTSSALFNGGMLIDEKDYITVQDFRMVGATLSIEGSSASADCDHIQVRRFYIHDNTTQGIDIDYGDHIVIGGYSGDGGKIENVGTGTGGGDITFENTQNWAVIGNELTADENDGDSGDRGTDGIVTQYADYGLIDLNTIHGHNDNYGDKGENAIDLKRESEYIVIRRNHIYNHWMEPNVTIQGGSGNVYLIGNRIRYGKQGVLVYARNDGYKAMDEVVLIANEIYGNGVRGMGILSAGDTINDVRVHNNTFVYNGYSYTHPITGGTVLAGSSSVHVLAENSVTWHSNNNIFYMGQADPGSDRRAWYIPSGYLSGMDYNTYEHDEGEAWVYDGTAKAFSTFQGADNDVSEYNGDDRDPLMTDPDGTDNTYGTVDDDYTLQAGSNEIADGKDVSVSRSVDIADSDAWMIAVLGFGSISIDFDEALDPAATDFSTTPPTVTLTNRSSSRDRGAYVYVAP